MTTRVNLNTIHFLGSDVLHAKKQKYLHNPSTGMGGTRAAISRPEAVAATTRTVNPCGPANPCRSLPKRRSLRPFRQQLISTHQPSHVLPVLRIRPQRSFRSADGHSDSDDVGVRRFSSVTMSRHSSKKETSRQARTSNSRPTPSSGNLKSRARERIRHTRGETHPPLPLPPTVVQRQARTSRNGLAQPHFSPLPTGWPPPYTL